MNTEKRIASLRARMLAEEVGAFICTRPHNVAYLTGFEGVFDEEEAHAVVVTQDALLLYTDARYGEAATRAAQGTGWSIRLPKRHLLEEVCSDVKAGGSGPVVAEDSMAHTRFKYLAEHCGQVSPGGQWVEEIRQVKEPEEIDRIAAAQQLTDLAFEHIVGRLRPGVTEREIGLDLEFFMRRNGGDGVAFPPIVASGPNSALPHAKVTGRELTLGDLVKLDFGARVDGYCADMTRTVVMGRADEHQREVYDAVREANLAGIAAVSPGLLGREIDSVARAVLNERGMGELFAHGLGHGVGLEVHELPGVGPRGSKPVLERSVITIEPGVYEPGVGGVRIEDLVVVEATGARVLTRSPKDLLEL